MKRVYVIAAGLIIAAAAVGQMPTGGQYINVRDLNTGGTLSNATVTMTGSLGTVRNGNTGGSHQIYFDGMPINETYTVSVSRADYRARSLPGIVLVRDSSPHTTVYLTSTLQTVGAVTGIVRNAMTAAVVPNCMVWAGFSSRWVWTMTDANGRYTINDLPRALYSMSVDKEGFREQGGTLDITPGSTATADYVLTPLTEPVGALYGYVTDLLFGTAVPDSTVTLTSDAGWSLSYNTGSDNYYRWDQLPARSVYRLAVTATNYRSGSRVQIWLSSAYETRIDLALASFLTAVGTLTGTIFDMRTGNPVPNAYVQVSIPGTSRVISVWANGAGVFQINDLPPVPFHHYADAPGYHYQSLYNLGIQQGANSANILLPPLDMPVGSMYFRARDFGTSAAVNNVSVKLTTPGGRSMTSSSGTSTNDFVWENLPVDVTFTAEAVAPNYRSRSYAGVRTRQDRQDTFDLWMISMDVNAANLSGKVRNIFTGQGISGASIYLSQVTTNHWVTAVADANGNFSTTGLFPGTYHVYFDAPGYSSVASYHVPLAVGDNVLEYSLTPYGYATGRLYGDVYDAQNSQGIDGATVLMIASTGTTRLTYTGTGSFYDLYELPYDLRYTVIGIAPGYQQGSVVNIEVPAFAELRVNIPLNAGSGGLVGRLVLDSYDVSPAGVVQALVQLRDPTTHVVITENTVTLGDSGAFVVSNVPDGSYEVYIKASHWLSTVSAAVQLPNIIPYVFQSGLNGDTNADNAIDDADITNIILDYGTSGGTNGETELNGDLSVDDTDLTLVILAYGNAGEP